MNIYIVVGATLAGFFAAKVASTITVEVYDHDFPSLAEGAAVPHTLYDMERNEAYVNIGTSRDTSEFSCYSIRHWRYTYGSLYYPLATSILLLMEIKKIIKHV